ncbi:GTPase [Actinomycetes bacterium NPDC127524]
MSIYDDIEKIKQQIEKEDEVPLKIALFGQPGAGKSSIINKLVGEQVAKTGASTDVTVDADFIPYEGLLLVDLPGYGTSKFPPNEWMSRFDPKDFDLFLCVFSGKFHDADTAFFKELKEEGRVCLFVRNMADQLWEDGKTLEELEQNIRDDVEKQVGSKEKVYFTSCRNATGFDVLQEAITQSLKPAQREKYTRYAKAYTMDHLEAKKEECKKLVVRYAAIAAANGINPIPGVDVSVDFSVMLKLFSDIRKSYGLNDEKISKLEGAMLPLAKKVLDYATREGVALLLKRFAAKTAMKSTAKFVPIVGQIAAASAGYAMTYTAGNHFLNDCHELAAEVLKKELS